MRAIKYQWLDELTNLINAELDKLYRNTDTLSQICHYSLSSGGKRIRPILAILACESLGGHRNMALPIGIAYELIHTASLIQDDIFDNSSHSRGQLAILHAGIN